MSDRHVRRAGEDYRDAFLALLPQGQAWPKRSLTSTLWQACDGLCNYWGFVDGRAADLLEVESDPRSTQELLPDWERNFGLPDPCYSTPQTIGDRQKALVQRMTTEGGQSRQFFLDLAATAGYSITISEHRPFMAGIDRVGDSRVIGDGTNPMFSSSYILGFVPVRDADGLPVANGALSQQPNYGLGPPEVRYFWTVHVNATSLAWFRVGGGGGQCGVNPELTIGVATDLECILARWKPAHTEIIFDYSGLGPDDPMAGTP
jgi:uncharacterized protein YmfQ (DUF2313 family)